MSRVGVLPFELPCVLVEAAGAGAGCDRDEKLDGCDGCPRVPDPEEEDRDEADGRITGTLAPAPQARYVGMWASTASVAFGAVHVLARKPLCGR